ncbi:MAG: hypothetical protein ACI9MR_003808 [Myxococcota bacterium]|jgi:hypothetical protein
MVRHLLLGTLGSLAFGVIATAGCANDSSSDAPALACGIVPCTGVDLTGDDFDPESVNIDVGPGKADAADEVAAAIVAATQDKTLSLDEVDGIFEAAGRKISVGEIRVIGAAIREDRGDYEVDADARAEIRFRAYTANLSEIETDYLRDGFTFGGTELPEAVYDAMVTARLNGAIAYDVNEQDDDGEGIWSPYPATTPATDNMAWDYTEITPAALAADIADTDVEYEAISGVETVVHSSGQEYKSVTYDNRVGGTGNALSQYDEAYHPNIYARGSQGHIWANNMAILSDGSFHCLPAARRSVAQDVILTNPHLSRGARMLFNGHLDVRSGVVEGIEMSGRLSKLAAKGKAIFVDPVPLLEAWGFTVSDNVRLRYGNTRSGTPEQADGIIREAAYDAAAN